MALYTGLVVFTNVLGLLFVSVTSECVAKHDLETVATKLMKQIRDLNNRVLSMEETINKQSHENTELKEQLKELRSQSNESNAEFKGRLQELRSQINEVNAGFKEQLQGVRSQTNELNAEFKEQMREVRSQTSEFNAEFKGQLQGVRSQTSEKNAGLKEQMREVKSQTSELNAEFKGQMREVRSQTSELNAEFKGQLQEVRSQTSELNAELKEQMRGVRSRTNGLNGKVKGESIVKGKLKYLDFGNKITTKETDAETDKEKLNPEVEEAKEKVSGEWLYAVKDLKQTEEKDITKENEHQSEWRSLMKKLNLESKLIQGRQLTEKNEHIAFSVYVKDDITGLSKGDIIKFDGFMLNDGSGYDVSTGMFTAPHSGPYLFSFIVEDYHNQDLWVALYQDNFVRSLAVAEPSNPNQNVMGGNVVLLHVREGSRIWISISKGNRIQSGWSTFSGVLLH